LKVDVRVLSATRRDLDREVQEGRFREDLFHRLVVTRVELPPLRMRKGDVAILAKHFARELGGENAVSLSSDLLARWEDQNWPGNVRGLRNAVARELALGGLQTAEEAVDEEQAPTPEETAKALADAGPPSQPLPEVSGLIENILSKRLSLLEARQRIVEEFDRAYLSLALAESGGNVTRAAAISGLARRNFQILRTRRGV
jgi:two-component system response regulator HydG